MNQVFPRCCIFVATTFRLSCNTSLLMPTTSQSIYVKRALVVLHFFFYYRQESCRTIFHSIAVLLDETFFIVTTTMFFVRKWYLYKLFWWIRNLSFVNGYPRRTNCTRLSDDTTSLPFSSTIQYNTGIADPHLNWLLHNRKSEFSSSKTKIRPSYSWLNLFMIVFILRNF